MRLFKPKFRDRITGERRQAKRWYVRVVLNGSRRKIRAYTDKRASEELGAKLVTLAGLRESGIEPDAAMAKWIRELPDRMKERLAQMCLIDARNVSITKSLSEHLAAYKVALLNGSASPRQKGPDTPEHVRLIENRITAILAGISATHIAKVDPEKVADYLAGRRAKSRKEKGLSAVSSNHYLTAIRRFFSWMVRTDRASRNPLISLIPMDTHAHKKRVRRSFEPDELMLLLQYVRNAPDRFGIDSETRYWLYKVAAETGLRSGELRSLAKLSFDLAGPEPLVSVAAGYSKRRRSDVLPIRPETASGLNAFLSKKMATAIAFKMPSPCNVVRMLRADLAKARTAWIESAGTPEGMEERQRTSTLKDADDSGRVLDFHSFRVFFISAIVAGGADVKTTQELARHSSPMLTMNTYAKRYRGTERSAIAGLPELIATVSEKASATGTNGPEAQAICLGQSLPLRRTREVKSVQRRAMARRIKDSGLIQDKYVPDKELTCTEMNESELERAGHQ